MTNKEAVEFLKNMIDRESVGFVCPKSDGDVAIWEYHVMALNIAIKALERPEPCEDAVSREAVSEWLKQYGQDVLHGKYKFSLMYIWKNLMDLPSAQPEIIRCKDCRHNHDCNIQYHAQAGEEFYCGAAERRTDG